MPRITNSQGSSNFNYYYPPIRYVFRPLYRLLRKQGLNQSASIMGTWGTSAILHAVPLYLVGNPTLAGISGGFFLLLGASHTIGKYMQKKGRKLRTQILNQNLEKTLGE